MNKKISPGMIFGIIMITGGIAMGVGAGFMFKQSFDAQKTVASTKQEAETFCRKNLQTLGTIQESNGQLILQQINVADPRTALGDATLALAFCPQRSIASFCLGSGCVARPGNEVSMVVRLAAPK